MERERVGICALNMEYMEYAVRFSLSFSLKLLFRLETLEVRVKLSVNRTEEMVLFDASKSNGIKLNLCFSSNVFFDLKFSRVLFET